MLGLSAIRSEARPVPMRVIVSALSVMMLMLATQLAAVPVQAAPVGAVQVSAAQNLVDINHAVSCLAENGRIDVYVENRSDATVSVVVVLSGLQPRTREVPSGSSERITVTGRRDGVYGLQVTLDDVEQLDESLAVECDPDPVEVLVTNDCISGNGRVRVALANLTDSIAEYQVVMGTLAPRVRILEPSAGGIVTVTGRPDGDLPVAILRDGAGIDERIVDITCDDPLPDGLSAVLTTGCIAENGYFSIDVQNRTDREAAFEVMVTGLVPRTKTVASGRSARFTITGRPDGLYEVMVRRDAETLIAESDLPVICDPVRHLVPVVDKTISHDTAAFTQGLVMSDGRMFESTGAPSGFTSSIRELDPATGDVLRVRDFGTSFFGEGLALVDDRLFYLSWLERVVRVVDRDTFESVGEFGYEGQGWGLCYDGRELVMSDGSAMLRFRDPETFSVQREVLVTRDGVPVPRLNELECVDGRVWANVWLTDEIVQIDPLTGAVVAVVDASALEQPRPASANAVLNGIGFDSVTQRFWLTGKEWPTMFSVSFVVADNQGINR